MRIFAEAVAAAALAISLSGVARAQAQPPAPAPAPAPAQAQVLECRGGQKAQQVAELTFGRRIVGHIAVSETQWLQFIDNEITPRFPEGLTVYDASGQWRDPATKKIVRELSKVVLIVLPGNAEDLTRLNELTEIYKRRFKQQSVGMILRPACVSF
jgi:Protein of unknown function (DUF3574)